MCRIPLLPAGQHLLLLTWVKLVFMDFVEVIILANTNMHPYRSKHYTWNQVVSCFVFCFFTCHLTCFGGPLSPCTAHPNVKLLILTLSYPQFLMDCLQTTQQYIRSQEGYQGVLKKKKTSENHRYNVTMMP